MRDIFGGFRQNTGHLLYLKACDQICKPKEVGGLGFRKTKEVNRTFLAKLGWQLEKAQHKPGPKLLEPSI